MLRIIRFYIPMGASSLLAALTHVIINGVLARSPHPDVTISSYAVALSLSFLLDLPMNAIRQTSSKFARDRGSFRAVARLSAIVMAILISISFVIGWTPVGSALFQFVFGVKEELLNPTIQVYQVLALLYVFTALRSLFQGIIINQLRTGWMTIGMGIRVVVMMIMAWIFTRTGVVEDGRIGAWIFMVGVAIECAVASAEGWSLKNKLPLQPEAGSQVPISRPLQLLPFYMPLVYSSVVLVVLNPSIQAALNQSISPTVAVAAFAVATQLTNMAIWFCASIHQTVLQFYKEQSRNVLLLVTALSILCPVLMVTASTELGGAWLLEGVLHLQGELLAEVRVLLRVLAVQTGLFPWIDYYGGRAMLVGQTKAILAGKLVAVPLSLVLLVSGVVWMPHLNATLAGIVLAAAAPVELAVVYLWFRRSLKRMVGRQEPSVNMT